MPNEYAIASSGDEDEDRKALADFIVRDHLIKRGQCPERMRRYERSGPVQRDLFEVRVHVLRGRWLNFELGEAQ